jgi:prevent-host-death family protein
MRTVDIDEAKAHLSRLIDEAAKGEPFLITRDGKPLVKVVPFGGPDSPRRFGFLVGVDHWAIPDDFDRMFEDEIREMFEGEP